MCSFTIQNVLPSCSIVVLNRGQRAFTSQTDGIRLLQQLHQAHFFKDVSVWLFWCSHLLKWTTLIPKDSLGQSKWCLYENNPRYSEDELGAVYWCWGSEAKIPALALLHYLTLTLKEYQLHFLWCTMNDLHGFILVWTAETGIRVKIQYIPKAKRTSTNSVCFDVMCCVDWIL